MSAPIDVLEVIRKVAVFNGGLIADDLRKVELALKPLLKAGRQLSADLEHAIAVANFGSPETVTADHPIRRALDEFDAAIERVQPASHGAGVSDAR